MGHKIATWNTQDESEPLENNCTILEVFNYCCALIWLVWGRVLIKAVAIMKNGP